MPGLLPEDNLLIAVSISDGVIDGMGSSSSVCNESQVVGSLYSSS